MRARCYLPTFSLSRERVSRVCLLAPGGKLRAHCRGAGIFDPLFNDECLFGVLDGSSTLTELVQRQTHIIQRIAFASAIANLPSDSQALFKELDGAAGLAQEGVGIAQVAERI